MEKLIRNEDITTSGFVETILEVLNAPIGVAIVENMLKTWNQAEISIMNEVITTSGFAETIFGSLIHSYRSCYSWKDH